MSRLNLDTCRQIRQVSVFVTGFSKKRMDFGIFKERNRSDGGWDVLYRI